MNTSFGFLCLIPSIVAVTLALITKQTVLSLFVAVWAGSTMINGYNPIIGFIKIFSDYIYGKLKVDIGKILRVLCERKGIEIIEAECCPDHIHMLVSIPPKYSVAEIVGYLKGKSSLMIFDRNANLKYKYGNRHLVLGFKR